MAAGKASKDKGKRFEREIAKYLTDLFGVGEFLRTHSSGAFTGGANAFRKDRLGTGQTRLFLGDIIPPDGVDLVVECKNHSEFGGGFHSLMSGENKKLDGWISEVYADSHNGEIPYVLVFKITGTRKTFWCLPRGVFGLEVCLKTLCHTLYLHKESGEFFHIVESEVFEKIKDSIFKVIKRG